MHFELSFSYATSGRWSRWRGLTKIAKKLYKNSFEDVQLK